MAVENVYKKSFYLIFIMALIALTVLALSIATLYNAAFQEERQRLIDTAQSQARLMEAVARFDKKHSGVEARNDTLSQIRAAHAQFSGFGETGEFTLAKRENNQIVFLLNHRHDDMSNLRPVPFDAKYAEPMRRALQGQSGTIVGLDYRGETVLAAHEPVAELNLGVVAKIDLKEIRAPFLQAALITTGAAIFLVLIGSWVFQRITKPIQTTINNLSGILPICAWCSNQIKDDNGEWVKLEKYIEGRTDASFSHGICPKCSKGMVKKSPSTQ